MYWPTFSTASSGSEATIERLATCSIGNASAAFSISIRSSMLCFCSAVNDSGAQDLVFSRASCGSGSSDNVGRRSGRTYRTALGAHGYGDGFLLPLGYGTKTDWYRNVMAAKTCQLAWKGHTYQLERPEMLSGPDAVQAWPLRQRITLRLAGIHDFVWLRERVG